MGKVVLMVLSGFEQQAKSVRAGVDEVKSGGSEVEPGE